MDLCRCFAVRAHRQYGQFGGNTGQYGDRRDVPISQGLRIDPGRLMSKLLHVLNVRPGINSGMCGPCRSHRPVRAHVSRDREGTCGHAIRRSWCLRNPSGRPPAFPWSTIEVIRRFVEHQEVRRVVEHARHCQPRFSRHRRVRGSSYPHRRRRIEMLRPGCATSRYCPGENPLQLFGDGEIGIQQIEGLLREVAHTSGWHRAGRFRHLEHWLRQSS